MQNLVFILNEVSPVFFLIIIGMFLKSVKMINEVFVDMTSKFVFNVSLPAFIFLKLYDINLDAVFNVDFILLNVFGTLLIFALSWITAEITVKAPEDKGVFIQGSFRSNYAIIGLALMHNLFGAGTIAKATLILAFVLPLYNVLSVFALIFPFRKIKHLNYLTTARDVLMNPLIIAVGAAIPFSLFKINLMPAVVVTGEHLSSIALPLALVGIGGSMNIATLKKASNLAVGSTFIKIIASPVLITLIAYLLGYRNDDLGIVFIVFGCPTAIASFIMAAAMGGNGRLAGNIVVISTLASVLTLTVGLFVLKSVGLI